MFQVFSDWNWKKDYFSCLESPEIEKLLECTTMLLKLSSSGGAIGRVWASTRAGKCTLTLKNLFKIVVENVIKLQGNIFLPQSEKFGFTVFKSNLKNQFVILIVFGWSSHFEFFLDHNFRFNFVRLRWWFWLPPSCWNARGSIIKKTLTPSPGPALLVNVWLRGSEFSNLEAILKRDHHCRRKVTKWRTDNSCFKNLWAWLEPMLRDPSSI